MPIVRQVALLSPPLGSMVGSGAELIPAAGGQSGARKPGSNLHNGADDVTGADRDDETWISGTWLIKMIVIKLSRLRRSEGVWVWGRGRH